MVWDGCSESDSKLLESLQIEDARVVTGALKETNRVSPLNDLSWVELSLRRKIHKLSLMYKVIFKLAPPYLCDLCPNFVSERSSYSLRSANHDLCSPFVRTERQKKSVLFSSIQEWNSLPLETRISSSPGIFKRNLLRFLHFPSQSYLFYIGDRSASIFHTRLRLNFSALNYHLFQKNCCPPPACALCNASIKDVKHYFLYYPSFAALREKLFTSAAQLLGNRWHCASDKKKLIGFQMVFLPLIFKLTLGCFSFSSCLFCYQIASVSRCVCFIYIYIFFSFYSFAFLCVCSILTCICIFKIFKC